MTDRRWEKAAARENARRDAKAPLFAAAGLVEHTTAAERKARVERIQDDQARRFAANDERSRRKIDIMRADLRTLIGDAGVAAFDVRRKWWPKSPEYELDGLTEELAKATGRTPLDVFEAYKAKLRVAEPVRVEVSAAAPDVGDAAAEEEAAAVDEAGDALRRRTTGEP